MIVTVGVHFTVFVVVPNATAKTSATNVSELITLQFKHELGNVESDIVSVTSAKAWVSIC